MKQLRRTVKVHDHKDITKRKYEGSKVIAYDPGEQIKAEVWPKVYKDQTFEFEGKTWLVIEALNVFGRVDIPTSVVAVYRPPIETT